MNIAKIRGTSGEYYVNFGKKRQMHLLLCINGLKKIFTVINHKNIWTITKQLFEKKYWNKTNIIEFWAFSTKLAIIFPGLLFGKQWWWLFVFALASSLALIFTSTIKTLPTIIYFNIGWSILATVAIFKHFV
jgi:hypothetical protein